MRAAGLGSNVLIAQFLRGGVNQGPNGAVNLCGRIDWLRPDIETCLPEQLHEEEFSLNDLRPGMSITAKLKLREKPVIATVFAFMSDLFTPIYEEK